MSELATVFCGNHIQLNLQDIELVPMKIGPVTSYFLNIGLTEFLKKSAFHTVMLKLGS